MDRRTSEVLYGIDGAYDAFIKNKVLSKPVFGKTLSYESGCLNPLSYFAISR